MHDFIEWLSKYLGIEKNPTATIIVSVSVFGLGILVNEALKEAGKYRERQALREIMRRNYLIFKHYLYEQASALKTFEQHISENSSPDFNLYFKSCSALDTYREISYGNSFEAFFVGLENIRLLNRIIRVQAFDNLYRSLSDIKSHQDKMFPMLVKFKQEASEMDMRWKLSVNTAFERTGDVYILASKHTQLKEVADWLAQRDRYYNEYISSPNPQALDAIRNYFYTVLVFEKANLAPLTKIMDIKALMDYHYITNIAIRDLDIMLTHLKTTKHYCLQLSEKFKDMGEKLGFFYRPLFSRKLK